MTSISELFNVLVLFRI